MRRCSAIHLLTCAGADAKNSGPIKHEASEPKVVTEAGQRRSLGGNRDDDDVCKRNRKSSKPRAIYSGKFSYSAGTIDKSSGLLSRNFE